MSPILALLSPIVSHKPLMAMRSGVPKASVLWWCLLACCAASASAGATGYVRAGSLAVYGQDIKVDAGLTKSPDPLAQASCMPVAVQAAVRVEADMHGGDTLQRTGCRLAPSLQPSLLLCCSSSTVRLAERWGRRTCPNSSRDPHTLLSLQAQMPVVSTCTAKQVTC